MAYYYLQFLAARTAYLLSPWRRQMMAEVSLTEADPKFCNPAAVPVKVPLGTCRCLFLWALSRVLLRFLLQAGCHHTLGTQHLGFDNSAGLIPVLAGGSFCSQTTFLRTSAYSKASEKFVWCKNIVFLVHNWVIHHSISGNFSVFQAVTPCEIQSIQITDKATSVLALMKELLNYTDTVWR